MAGARVRLIAVLSALRASLVQRIDGRGGVAAVVRRAFPRQFLRAAARAGPEVAPEVADLGRPLRFPQRGSGSATLETVPPVGSAPFARRLAVLRRRNRVVVTLSDQDVEVVAEPIAVMAAAGVPLELVGSDPSLDAALGGPLAQALRTAAPAGRRDRELRSIAIRRAAHDRLFPASLERPVSVLLATRRPGFVAAALDQIGRQARCELQVVLGLHGDGWPDDVGAWSDRLPDGSCVVRFDEATPLGVILNELVARSDAELVTKWDDDDWYGPDHLADLLRAYAYSGAEVVGKAAEFVYLERRDETIRRFATGAESYGRTIAGGTILTSRRWLDEIGGWPPIPARVDQVLLAATADAGGLAYRTHGFQYVLRRHASARHTWAADDELFAATAVERRAGLDLEFADVATGQSVAS